MKKLVDIEGEDLEYVKREAKEGPLTEKKIIELCVRYVRKRVIKIETYTGGDKIDLSEV